MKPNKNLAATGKRCGYFDHSSGVGIIGHGLTLEEAFEAAATATFAMITSLTEVRLDRSERIEFEEADVGLALVRWLNLLLEVARDRAMVFAEFRLERDGVVWRGMASGETQNNERGHGIEVKGATLAMLRVEQTAAA